MIESDDNLVKSFASNQSYMAKNKFIAKTSASPDVSNNINGKKQKIEEKTKQNDFEKELKEQN